MDEKIVLQLGRPLKIGKDTCVVCGAKQWKCFNSIHSARSKNKEIPKLLQLHCHINIARGGMCNSCEKVLLKMSRKIEQFRTSCHETLVKNRLMTRESLSRTGIQSGKLRNNNIAWPGKENLFVALSVCSNLPSALHHTIKTEHLSLQREDVKPVTDESSFCRKEHSYVKGFPRVCIKAECFAKPVLPNDSKRTALPLAQLAARKIGEIMGTASLGSARLYRQAFKSIKLGKEKEETHINGANKSNVVNVVENSMQQNRYSLSQVLLSNLSSQSNKGTNGDVQKTNLRYTSVQEIQNEADWLYKNKIEFDVNEQKLDKDLCKTSTKHSKNKYSRTDQLTHSDQPKQKRLKFPNNIQAIINTKDIIHWESEWRKKNTGVYFACPITNCSELLLGKERDIHITTHRENIKNYCCPECDFQHGKWAAMRDHLRCSHSIPNQIYNCNEVGCDHNFNSFKKLRQHMLYTHDFESALQTDKDARKSFDRKLFEEESVNDELLSNDLCSVCGMACKLDNLLAHERMHFVSGCALLQCVACQLLFTADQIKDHVLAMHRKLTYLYQCETCEFSSETSAGLQRHMGIKHVNAILLVCDKCGKGFKTAAALNVHHKRIHVTEDEKTVLCSTCGYLCAHETLLKEHIRKVHKKPSWRRFKCTLCDHFSLRESSLERHMQMYHSNSMERQFKCSYCQYASKTKANLLKHELIHKGHTPFLCPHCDFTDAKKQIVQDHIVAEHTKDISYNCNICGSVFGYHGDLVSHMEHHRAGGDIQNFERIVTDEQEDRLYFQL